jgi:hypothetical protein
MSQEIESVKPAISVIIDDGDWIINSTGPYSKVLSQAVLPLAAGAHKVILTVDGETRVMKRNGNGANASVPSPQPATKFTREHMQAAAISEAYAGEPDIQDQFAADLDAGRTGEAATGEVPSPTPGPSDPVKIPVARRKPQIFQDAAAPPSPELAEVEMDRLLAEAAQAEKDAAKVAEDRRFQAQQAVQSGTDPIETEAEAKPAPRKREPRALATVGRACGRCAGAGQIVGEAGFAGSCPVCHGEGQTQVFARGPKFR